MKILFLCIANSARSQMAEGFARAMFQKHVEIESAGSRPSGFVHPIAIQVMKESGIDISKQYSKSWDRLSPAFLLNLDFMITLCEEECPNLSSKATNLSWGISDPASASKNDDGIAVAFRMSRDKIRAQIEKFGLQHGLL